MTAGHYVNVIRRQKAAGQMRGLDVAYPFRDRDLVAFLMAIPGDIVNWRGVPKGLLRQSLTGILPDAIRDRRWKADGTPMSNYAARRDHMEIARALQDSCSVRAGLVDREVLESSVRDFATSIAGDQGTLPGWDLTDLIGLEQWLRAFMPPRADSMTEGQQLAMVG